MLTFGSMKITIKHKQTTVTIDEGSIKDVTSIKWNVEHIKGLIFAVINTPKDKEQ